MKLAGCIKHTKTSSIEKIKGNLVSHIMTPLTVTTNNRFILKILVQETLSNISKR